MRLNSSNDYGKDGNMSNSIYYKATDEDGNTVLKHALEKNKYLYTKNGKYVYPEDVNKEVKIVKKVAKRDTSEKAAATKYFPDKASKSQTANAARVKTNSVKSNAEYKLTRAGEKLTNDVNSSVAYRSANKGINSISKNANKAYKPAKKKTKKVNRTFNKVDRAGKAYLDYLTK